MKSFKLLIKTLLGDIHKLLGWYLTFSVASATSERSFSALQRLKNYLRSTMKQDRLNNCLQLAFLCIVSNRLQTHWTPSRLQRGLLVPTNYAKDIFGNFSRGMRLAWCTMSPPPPPHLPHTHTHNTHPTVYMQIPSCIPTCNVDMPTYTLHFNQPTCTL